MKKAEQILEDYDYACYRGTCHKELFSISEVTKLLKQAQEDAIRETVKECDENYVFGQFRITFEELQNKLIQQL